jgi:hypothetical protein
MIIALRKVPVGLIYTALLWKSVKMELVLQMVVIPAPMDIASMEGVEYKFVLMMDSAQ